MPNFPTSYDDKLKGASPEQLGAALGALFNHFPIGRDVSLSEIMPGYLDSLRGYPLWAVEEIARDFIAGRVDAHDGRFLPSSAEFGKAVSARVSRYREFSKYQGRSRRQVEAAKALIAPLMSEETKAKRGKQVEDELKKIGSVVRHNDVLFDAGGRRRRWPAGTTFDAKSGTITVPDKGTMSYQDWWNGMKRKTA